MRRIIIHLRPVERRGGRSGGAQRVITAPKLPFCDLRLFAAAAAAAIAFHTLSKPELAEKRGRLQVARGELGVQIMSFALSPVNALITTTNTAGRIALRAPESGWQIERLLDFPGFATEVAFAPDGRSLAVVSKAPGIYLWELDSPNERASRSPAGFDRAAQTCDVLARWPISCRDVGPRWNDRHLGPGDAEQAHDSTSSIACRAASLLARWPVARYGRSK